MQTFMQLVLAHARHLNDENFNGLDILYFTIKNENPMHHKNLWKFAGLNILSCLFHLYA